MKNRKLMIRIVSGVLAALMVLGVVVGSIMSCI